MISAKDRQQPIMSEIVVTIHFVDGNSFFGG
jgi:hypothetical protein